MQKRKAKRGPVLFAIVFFLIFLEIVAILSRVGAITGNEAMRTIITFFPIVMGISNSIFNVSIPGVNQTILSLLTILAAAFEIWVCVSIFKQKKWAFVLYAWLIAILGLLSVINEVAFINAMRSVIPETNTIYAVTYSIFPYLVKGFLLIVAYMVDGKYFNVPSAENHILQTREKEQMKKSYSNKQNNIFR